MNELTTIESGPLSAQQVRSQVNLIQEVMRDVMQGPTRDKDGKEVPGVHYGLVPGCGGEPTLLQPGAQKLLMTFRLVSDPEMTVIDIGVMGHREVRCKVRLYTQGGVFLGAGVGVCSTMEGKYRFRSGPVEFTDRPVPKEYWDMRSKDPKRAQALLGEGMQAKKNESGMWVCARKGAQVEHDNPADYYNTVEKMAYKRALVSATLTVTAASDIFTQDVEDMPEVIPQTSVSPASDARKANQDKLKKMQQGDMETAQEEVGQTKLSTIEEPPPEEAQTPQLDAANICQQFTLSEAMPEWSEIANAWQEESHLHTDAERKAVKAAADAAKKRIEKKK